MVVGKAHRAPDGNLHGDAHAGDGAAEACLVNRNDPMHDSVPYLRNALANETDILHEYFIPRSQFVSFIDGMRKVLPDNKTNLLNASVRIVHQEDIS